MKVRKVIKLIESDGWFHVRTKGDHRQYHHPTKTGTVTVAGKLTDEVPPGTLIYDRDRGNQLRDLTEAGQEVVVARGGKGGRGNKSFATSINRAAYSTEAAPCGHKNVVGTPAPAIKS